MAGEISSLTLLGAPSGPLAIEVLDEADTTMSSSGTNKRAILAGPYLIEKIVNSSAGEFDFDSIPAGFSRLIIRGILRGDLAATTDGVWCILNTDTTAANYHYKIVGGEDAGSSFVEGTNPYIANCTAGSSPANSYSDIMIVIEEYTGSQLKMISCQAGGYLASGNVRNTRHVVKSAITAAITRIRIRTDNHATDQLFGTLSLYGEI
jgi:hypothetical protein